jgi:hypothetical protein
MGVDAASVSFRSIVAEGNFRIHFVDDRGFVPTIAEAHVNSIRTMSILVVIPLALALAPAAGFAKSKGGGGGGGSGGGSGHSHASAQSPASAAHAAPSSQPAKDDAVAKAQADMDAAEHKVRGQFESTSDWTTAQAAVDKAKAALSDARDAVSKKLKEQTVYQSALTANHSAETELDRLHKSGSASSQELTDAAAAAMSTRLAVSKLETDAYSTDPAASAAKTELDHATVAIADLRKKEHAAVEADTDWQAAKQRYDEAKSKLAAASR